MVSRREVHGFTIPLVVRLRAALSLWTEGDMVELKGPSSEAEDELICYNRRHFLPIAQRRSAEILGHAAPFPANFDFSPVL